MRQIKWLLPPLVYAIGLTSFFAFDILVARYDTDAGIAAWATLKGTLFIGGTLCLLGLDQALVRNPNSAMKIVKILAVQILVLSAVITGIFYSLALVTSPLWYSLATALFAASILGGAFYRARMELLPALLNVHSWKFIAIILVFIALQSGENVNYLFYITLALLVGVMSATLVGIALPKERISHAEDTEKDLFSFYKIGIRFFASAFLLNLSLHLEQLTLNYFDQTEVSATYFRYVTLFLLPLVAANGFLGFIIGPYIRKHQYKFDQLIGKYWPAVPAISIVMATGSLLVGSFIFPYLFPKAASLDWSLVILISLIGFTRFNLIFSSGYLGVHATGRQLDQYILLSALGIALMIIIFILLQKLGVHPAHSMAFASLCNWLVRVLSGTFISKNILSERILRPEIGGS